MISRYASTVGEGSGERASFQERQIPPVWAHLHSWPFPVFVFFKSLVGYWLVLLLVEEGCQNPSVLCTTCPCVTQDPVFSLGPQGQNYFPSNTKTWLYLFTLILSWVFSRVFQRKLDMWSHKRLKADLRLQIWKIHSTSTMLLSALYIFLFWKKLFFIKMLTCNGFIFY